MAKLHNKILPYLLIFPQLLILLLFLVLPIALIAVVSFWQFNGYSMTAAFSPDNYLSIFTSRVYRDTYLNTFKFVGLVWGFCLLLAYPVAYFLAFHIKSFKVQLICFVLCTIPFFTSNIIRMISWLPLLGREGLVNGFLLKIGAIEQPLEQLLFSDFAVVLALVHLYVLFMVVPIFNSLIRIEPNLIAAAKDLGASGGEVLRDIILPLSRPGIAIGSIFVVTLVMGEFITVRWMGGGQASSVGYLISNQIGSLQYPLASANAMILLVVTIMFVAGILRLVDIRKQL
ncbi:MAG: ABC transporter permease [Cyanobacteria bacterium P01_A01_bin.3]